MARGFAQACRLNGKESFVSSRRRNEARATSLTKVQQAVGTRDQTQTFIIAVILFPLWTVGFARLILCFINEMRHDADALVSSRSCDATFHSPPRSRFPYFSRFLFPSLCLPMLHGCLPRCPQWPMHILYSCMEPSSKDQRKAPLRFHVEIPVACEVVACRFHVSTKKSPLPKGRART